ncbi:MAG: hypothetical protein ABIM50_08425 [Novosphingobium sp.]
MTLEQRNAQLLKALDEQAKRKTSSKEAARASLIAGSIYTAKGNLRAEFGGRNWKSKAAG